MRLIVAGEPDLIERTCLVRVADVFCTVVGGTREASRLWFRRMGTTMITAKMKKTAIEPLSPHPVILNGCHGRLRGVMVYVFVDYSLHYTRMSLSV